MRRLAVLLLCLLAPLAALAQVTGEMRPGINFPGADIGSSPIGDNNPLTCLTICELTDGCEAWTYVKPGIQGPTAMCWIKSEVPAAEVSECCISGTMEIAAASPEGEFFPRPLIGAHDVAACLSVDASGAGTDCGQPAADAFCRSFGYAGASDWSREDAPTTYAIGAQIICEAPESCPALRDVTCAPK